jgi:hypothetical protein
VNAALVGITVVSSRLLWPIPTGIDDARRTASLDMSWSSLTAILDKLFVIENYYSNLWSFYGSRPVHIVQLVFDLCLVAALAVYLRRRRTLLQLFGSGVKQTET